MWRTAAAENGKLIITVREGQQPAASDFVIDGVDYSVNTRQTKNLSALERLRRLWAIKAQFSARPNWASSAMVFCCLLFLDRCAAEFSAGAIEMAYFFFFRKITMLAPSPIRATALTTSTTVQVWMLLSSPVGALEVLSWR